ncbi:MAG: YHS domain-containing protein [Ferruginibacter sp.]|nr:YHS domain-containing protein [Ferruginibacter sp.]
MKKTIPFILLLLTACNQPAEKAKPKPDMPMPVATDTAKAALKKLAFDAETDLVCGMPVRAGIEDTLHYKGKLYGFCAKECKEEFLKDPAQYITKK